MSASRYPKPTTPSRGDGNAFINAFETDSADVPRSSGTEAVFVPTTEPHVPEPVVPAKSRRKQKELKIPMTYKHRETHYKRLKKISQALEVPMGELLDEALAAKFAEWEAEIG